MPVHAFWNVVAMSFIMGVGSYGAGLLPLSFSLSKTHLTRMSTLGTGLFIGSALGVVIPEGIEGMVSNNPDTFTSKIALWILLGFASMFLVEEYLSPHAKPLASHESAALPSEENHNIDLEELEREEGVAQAGARPNGTRTGRDPYMSSVQRAYPLSLGLIVHSFVDGYALGVSASKSMGLSMIVFLAIIVHKAPTALALTTSLLSMSLPASECKRHLMFFSLSTPVAALISFVIYSYAGGEGDIQLGAPLLFSGGTFLYVATVLQSVSDHVPASSRNETSKNTRTVLLLTGMFTPLLVSNMLGHGH
ncbi:Zinc/iron permease [Leucogyrophana mollusca]|uniref:Zinc/iron permease n=1 Tax=Leucogyrophana mollusca TaxID=85980 RepID=A0ACB8BQK9_9AGAM|nr:Zinc/iron permease [Leucogyrophana mollusca]